MQSTIQRSIWEEYREEHTDKYMYIPGTWRSIRNYGRNIGRSIQTNAWRSIERSLWGEYREEHTEEHKYREVHIYRGVYGRNIGRSIHTNAWRSIQRSSTCCYII